MKTPSSLVKPDAEIFRIALVWIASLAWTAALALALSMSGVSVTWAVTAVPVL
ncbi:MAG: hypothetical protein JO184_00835 [Gammaproteobacteria bacterium]|nr:hypothetical protein [Gammaproteobacteria bacterium]MBV8306461.1 hypothetical protein [Gammaproteobacteria bacterium]MBV8405563.1 hypothetical protein [Gammaproteobacteria bacterium]